jgi:hypothetical protein
MSRWTLAWVGILLVAAPLSAEEKWPVKRGPSREPTPYRYRREQLDNIPREFLEEADACIVYMADVRLLSGPPHSQEEFVHHRVIRCNRAAAFPQVGEFRDIRYEPNNENLILNEAAVHKPDGRVLAVRPDQVRVRDLNTTFLKYSDRKMLIVSFPGLEAGDIVEAKWTVRRRRVDYQRVTGRIFFGRLSSPRFGEQEDDATRDSYPVARQVIRLGLPSKCRPIELRFAVTGGLAQHREEEQASYRLHIWESANYRPPANPGQDQDEQRLTLYYSSGYPSWQALAPDLRDWLEGRWKCTSEIKRLVEEQTQGRPSPEAKARALTEWARKNIRYLSAGHVGGPHTPARTLSDRYGNC